MVIVINIENFPLSWVARDGLAGESRIAHSADEYLRVSQQVSDPVAVVNCDPRLTLELAARFAQRGGPALVAVDLVLRRPKSVASLLLLPFKRLLLKRVDLFIHYFKDLRAYKALYGIGANRSSFVSFKVNLHTGPKQSNLGEYVLCLGRTLRDFDTFFAAMEEVPYAGAIAKPDFHQLKLHGSRFTRAVDQLSRNIRVLDDDGSDEAMLKLLEGARIVAVPILKESIAASGCSTSLNAMWLGKCVIGTEGPGWSDVFEKGEIISVPPENPSALAEAIRRVWEDDDLRTRVANAGRQYAMAAGGEQELYQRIIQTVVDWYCTGRLRSNRPKPRSQAY